MGNLRLDLLTLSLEVSLLLHWYYFWTTSQKVFQFRWSILWNNEMRKKVKNKLINVCRTKSHKASAAEAHRGFHTPHQLTLCCRYGTQAAQPWQQLPNSKLLRVMQESPTNTGFYRFNSEFLPFCRLTRAICSILKQHWAVQQGLASPVLCFPRAHSVAAPAGPLVQLFWEQLMQQELLHPLPLAPLPTQY